MSSYTNRLNKLECAIRPGAKGYRFRSIVDYDEQDQCAEVVVYESSGNALLGEFTAQAGETTEALCARAYAAVGRQSEDGVIERHIISAG